MLIHLTRRAQTLTTILGEGRLRAIRAYGAAHNVAALAESQSVSCFSELAALDSVERLAQRHGQFGLGFRKSWLQQRGAAPVWYLPRDSQVQVEFFETVRTLAFRREPDPENVLWRMTPFVDYPREAGDDRNAVPYDWRWEREWRVRGDLPFGGDDVALLFAPERQHREITEWWKEHMIEGWGGYLPPLVDTCWPRDSQESAIRMGPSVVEIEILEPFKEWDDEVDTAPYLDERSVWDDERQQSQTEMREDLSGWLDEMARDDI